MNEYRFQITLETIKQSNKIFEEEIKKLIDKDGEILCPECGEKLWFSSHRDMKYSIGNWHIIKYRCRKCRYEIEGWGRLKEIKDDYWGRNMDGWIKDE